MVNLKFKQAMVTGKINPSGWLRDSGFVRHRTPHLDAAGAFADLHVFSLDLIGIDMMCCRLFGTKMFCGLQFLYSICQQEEQFVVKKKKKKACG